jgi:hypothetical protein
MKAAIEEVKTEIRAKLSYWNNIKSKKLKVSFIVLFFALIVLKIFTTVLTFDWFAGLIK